MKDQKIGKFVKSFRIRLHRTTSPGMEEFYRINMDALASIIRYERAVVKSVVALVATILAVLSVPPPG